LKSTDEYLDNLSKKLDRIEREKQIRDKPTKEEQKAKDWARYRAAKKEHYLHSTCTAEQCVLECLYFPEDGYQTEDGNIHYEDSDLDPSFMGTYGALETRKKIAAMSPKEYERYKQNLKLKSEYTEKTKKAIQEGKRLYVRSGIYPPWDDPENIPGAQYYEYKR
jgi:hypothetical protein